MAEDHHFQPDRRFTAGSRRALSALGQLFGRSFFPIMALVIILGTPLWGGWGTFILALVCWSAVMRYV